MSHLILSAFYILCNPHQKILSTPNAIIITISLMNKLMDAEAGYLIQHCTLNK